VQKPVDRVFVPDYNEWVAPSEELCIEDVERKLKAAGYSSAQELRDDFAQIKRNATAYNAPGAGQYGGPGGQPFLIPLPACCLI
jgi:hypothetical protein